MSSTVVCDVQNESAKQPEPEEHNIKQSESQTTLTGGSVGIFNTEDFLARANMNEKINSILRSPRPASGVRQRSVYTAITPSRFNANAAPFLSQQSSRSAGPILHSPLTPRDSTTSVALQSGRAISGPHVPLPANYHFSSFEPSITSRSAGVTRSVYSARFPMGTSSSMFPYENDLPRMHAGAPPTHPALQFPQPMPPPPFAIARMNGSHRDYETHMTTSTCPGTGPIAMNNGTIQLRLREGVR